MNVQVLEVGVNMVSIPVEWIGLHVKVVPGKVAGWVAEVMELVPEQSLGARRRRDHKTTNGKGDHRLKWLTGRGTRG